MNIRSIESKLEQAEEELPRLTTRRVFIARGFGLSLLLGSAGACRAESRAAKEAHEFFDPADLTWHPAPGHGSGVWERIVSGGRDEGVTTRFLRFDPGTRWSRTIFGKRFISSRGPSSAEGGRTRQAA